MGWLSSNAGQSTRRAQADRSGSTVVLMLAAALFPCVSAAKGQAPFLAPASRPAALGFDSPAPPDPPDIQPTLKTEALSYVAIPARISPRTPDAHAALRQAEVHFQAGRKAYFEGDEEAARREFDRAVDALLSAPETARSRPDVEKKLDELVDAIHHYDLAGLGAGDVSGEPGFEKSPLEEIPQMTFPIDPAIKSKVVEEVRATVSQLPLQVTDAVLSYIHYFSSEGGRKILVQGLRRAGRYRPMIQRILDEEGVPQELIYLAQAESGFLPRAVSSRKATGMWQFVQARGREYGLVRNLYSDDRLDPERATRSAARHLRDLYHRYGDWYLAMAAYNSGPGTIDRAVERTGYADFWEFRRRNVLPKETANYVPIILAMTIVGKNAKEYGLDDIDPDPAVEYDTVEMAVSTSLLLVSDLAESSVGEIRGLNPALLKTIAPAGYRLHVPKGTSPAVVAGLRVVPEDRRRAWRVHRVGDGESLAGIASRYHMTEKAIRTVNLSLEAAPEPGSLLVIPTAEPRTVSAKASAAKRPVRHARASRAATSTSRTKASTARRAPSKPAARREPAAVARRG